MRAIYRIARLELSNLFYSPIAWLILILFVFMTAMNFTDVLWAYARSQEFRGGGLSDLSRALFFDVTGRGLWPKISNLLYMIMPLLTMGLISQEFSRGSIKLLFVAPITSRHIVLGKFLGMMMYGLLMFSVLLVYVILGGCWIESFDWAAVLTGLLGLYLLFGTYAAIGLFMSTLTTYPIVAAIYMLALLTFLRFVSGLWQEYTFVRDITYWLALDRRAGTFINGMICSEDFLYFVIMTAMFLGFAILKLQFIRERRSMLSKVGRFLGVFIVAMLLGYVTSRPTLRFYHDSTHTKTNTLTEASQEIVSKLDGGLKMTTYVNLFGSIYNITPAKVMADIARYNSYIRFKPETKMDYVFYYYTDTTDGFFAHRFAGKTLSEAAKEMAKFQGVNAKKYVPLSKVDPDVDLRDEGYRFVVLLERENGEKTFLRVFNDAQRVPFETEISAALKRIGMKLPSVGFLSDHYARTITGDRNRDYSYMVSEKLYRSALINQGFDVVDVKLSRNSQLLDSLDVLVVSEPREPFSEEELDKLYRYVESGKNLIIAGKPRTNSYLAPLMEKLGLRFEPGILVQKQDQIADKNAASMPSARGAGGGPGALGQAEEREYPVSLFLCRATDEAKGLSKLWDDLYIKTNHPEWPYSIVMPEASAVLQVEDKGFRVTPLLVGRDPSSWNELETIDFVNETPLLNLNAGEQAGTKTTMMALERQQAGKEQRIVVIGDADAFSMGEVMANRRGILSINGGLIMSMFEWLSYGELPVDTSRPEPVDNNLTIGAEAAGNVKTMLQWILPVLILLGGVLLLFRRKGK